MWPTANQCYAAMLSPVFNKSEADDTSRFLLPDPVVVDLELDSLIELGGLMGDKILAGYGEQLPECLAWIKVFYFIYFIF